MKIQVISDNAKIKYGEGHEYTYSSLGEPITFDAFDLNIISLQTQGLWEFKGMNTNSINAMKDFQSLQPLLETYKKTNVIVCFPQNYEYRYYYNSPSYRNYLPLKDMIEKLKGYLHYLLPAGDVFDLVYENSTTVCGESRFNAAFYFSSISSKIMKLTKCIGGDHATTILFKENLIFTTLDLSKPTTNIDDFLKSVGFLEKKFEAPEWVKDVEFFDDAEQKKVINEASQIIEQQQSKIDDAEKRLQNNLKYKSILYETGEELVSVVKEMLEQMLMCDLSNFIDEKQEDFRIILKDVTFIGEIKGVSSNVKSENVSQVDNHCQSYSDKLDEEGKTENIKGILIINPLRNKAISERDEIHEKQIKLANLYGSLIITTETLLKLFNEFLEKRIDTNKIIDLLKSKIGLLTDSDFNN